MKKVIWKIIPQFPNYMASNFGDIKSLNYRRSGKEGLLSAGFDSETGYYFVAIFKNKKQFTMRNHVLVAMAFLDHVPCGLLRVVDHKNHIKTDNRVENLRITTNRINSDQSHIESSSKYTGVTKRKNKWEASIVFEKRLVYLGVYELEIEAHLAYQEALFKIEEGNYIPPPLKIKSSKYKGVSFDKKKNKWAVLIRINGKPKKFTGFKYEIDAHCFYQKIAEEINNGTYLPPMPKPTGVSWSKSRKKWVAYVNTNGCRLHLGAFSTEAEAIEARHIKLLETSELTENNSVRSDLDNDIVTLQ